MARTKIDGKETLVAELAEARARLSATGRALRRELDVPRRTRESFKRHRAAWLGGATLLGLVLSKLPARRKTVFVERTTGKALGAAGKLGLAWSAAKVAFNLARPFVSDFAAKHFGDAARRFTRAGAEARSDRP